MKISLIVATINRISEVELFFESMVCSTYKNFEILLIDQNEGADLDDIVMCYLSSLKIFHIKSPIKGLSYNRNVGIKMATGDILAFPDDDCTYYPDTLEKVVLKFRDGNIDFVLGRIFDRDKKVNIIKNWPRFEKNVTAKNFYFLSSSITLFSKFKNDDVVVFDENLGAGTKHGSCEDPDFIFTLLKKGCIGTYTPLVEVNHPIPSDINTPLSKKISYASGFGFMLGKYYSDFIFVLMGVGFIAKNLIRLAFGKLPVYSFKKIICATYCGFKDGVRGR